MARSFNPPPNWPRPPYGWTPPEGWQPDPSWGPAPQGWNFWTEDGATAEPVGAAAPSPFTPQSTPAPGDAPRGDAAPSPFGSPAPGQSSAGFPPPGAPTSPFASSASAPYSGAYVPGDAAATTTTPWFKKPLTWILVALLALVVVIAFSMLMSGRGGRDRAAAPTSTPTATQTATDAGGSPTDDATDGTTPSDNPTVDGLGENQPYGPNDEGSTAENPLPFGSTSSVFVPDTDEFFTITVNEPVFMADEAVTTAATNRAPSDGTHYALLPVEITYHGADTVSAYYSVNVAYVPASGTTLVFETDDILAPDDLWERPDISDGETASGNLVHEIPAGMEGTGTWAVLFAEDGDPVYFGAPPAGE